MTLEMTDISEPKRNFQMVVAASRQRGIGKNGALPWKLPADMKYFKDLTSTAKYGKRNAVIMGRKTWDSIPAKFRPLRDRVNIVLSRQDASSIQGLEAGVLVSPGLDDALRTLAGAEFADVETVFVIGGGQVYAEGLASDHCEALHYTLVETDAPCDTFFPEIDPARFKVWSATFPHRDRDSGLRFHFLCYTRCDREAPPPLPPAINSRHEEHQYLDLIRDVIDSGTFRGDRTGTGTLSKFGASMRFNLRHTFPVLTTKRVFWRGVAEELLWFVAGCTNAKVLQDKGVHIWDGNGSRAYLDSIGLSAREEMDLGPVYGFQWRHFGAEYRDMHADYAGQGIDQLAECIAKIKHNPSDRRIVLTAWNPAALPEMALPPCHMFCQFYVADGELSCQMYQRSCDLGLGVPFNIASYALLTRLVAQVCGLAAGDLVHVMGDAHVYANHVEPLQEQLKAAPRHFPTLRVNPAKDDIDAFVFEDLELVDYRCGKAIKMAMAV